MKSHKGFTLLELLIVLTIIAMLAVPLAYRFHNSAGRDEAYWNPEATRARATEKLAEQAKIANDLKKEELELRKQELLNATKPEAK